MCVALQYWGAGSINSLQQGIKTKNIMKTNESILSSDKITYSEIKLLKSRSNKLQKDVVDYDVFEGIDIDSESAKKGLEWLKSLLNSKGEPRKNIDLGYREMEIIKKATTSDFRFLGFYDCGNRQFRNFVPIYEVLGMEYIPYCQGRKIYVIG